MDKYVVALDLGVTQVRACLYRKKEEKLEICEMDVVNVEAVARGRVIDVYKLSVEIEQLLTSLFRLSGVSNPTSNNDIQIHYCVGVSGMSFETREEKYMTNLNGQMFTEGELMKFGKQMKEKYKQFVPDKMLVRAVPIKYELIESKSRITLPRVVYTAPFECSLDQIEISYLLTYVSQSYVDDIKTVLKCGDNVTFYPLTSAKAKFLCKEETLKLKDGFMMIDLGAGTTSVAAYMSGSLVNEFSFPFGVNTVTYDIMSYLNIDKKRAENIKTNLPSIVENKGCALTVDNMPIHVDVDMLKEVVQLRLEEIIAHTSTFCSKIYGNKKTHILCGLTGGGSYTMSVADIVKRMTDVEVQQFNYAEDLSLQKGNVDVSTVSTEGQIMSSGVYGMIMLYREEFADQFVNQRQVSIFDDEEKGEEEAKESKGVNKILKKIGDFLSPSDDIGESF
jgi:cell division protein FtsA